MPGMAQYYNIPLPKGWPRRVRSAVILVQRVLAARACRVGPLPVNTYPQHGIDHLRVRFGGSNAKKAAEHLTGRKHLPIVELKKAA